MNLKGKIISAILTSLIKLPILLSYGAFFAVQLFFSIGNDSYTSSKAIAYYSAQHKINNLHFTGDIKKTDKLHKKTKAFVRLNKRFEPECGLIYHPILVESPVYFASERTFSFFSSPSTCAADKLTFSLRGPPFV